MLRELPETELADNSDYERWYFEGQHTAWEAEGKEGPQRERAGGKLNEHRASQRGKKRETTIRSSSRDNIYVPASLEGNSHAR
jgi:hypothetical protein